MPRPTLKSSLSGNVYAQVVNSAPSGGAVSQRSLPSEFARLVSPYLEIASEKIAIAVSGGADSMALCLLADQWAKANGRRIVALTVNHGLRENAKDEAFTVADWLAAREIEHHILTWLGDKPKTGIQAAARQARYALMAGWCTENEVAILMTAHHLEDQIETFLLRMERGSGIDGLACMAEISKIEEITLYRPLLGISKHRLREYLNDLEQNWIEDPSNQNPVYRRTKMRKLVEQLEEGGLDAKRIAPLVEHFAELRGRLAEVVSVFFENTVSIFPEGYASTRQDVFRKLPDPIIERILVQFTSMIGAKPYPPRNDRLKRAVQQIRKKQFKGFTLGGCRYFLKNHEIMICREMRGLPAVRVAAGDHLIWADMYEIEIQGPKRGVAELAALGKKGWAEIVRKMPELKENSLIYPIRLTLPALFDAQGVLEVPHLNYRRKQNVGTGLSIGKLRLRASH